MIKENVNLKNLNTYGIGGIAKYVFYPSSIDELISKLKDLKEHNEKYYILGSGSNVILPDSDFDGTIIKLDNLNTLEIKDDFAYADAGILLISFIKKTLDDGYTNLVNLYGIPGTLGGAIVGNAGSFKSCIFDFIESIKVLDSNFNILELKKEDIKYSARTTDIRRNNYIVISAKIKLEKGSVEEAKELILEHNEFRKNNQPLEYKNAGSVFKNPENLSAGYLVDHILNMKDVSIGGASISSKHANFIINKNNATSSDIISLIEMVKKRAKEEQNIDLELEQIIVKW